MSNKAATQNNKSNTGFGKFVWITGVISGGIVGSDYAFWFKVDPVAGAVIGGLLSMILTAILQYFYHDKEGEVRGFCTSLGGLLGGIAGVVYGVQEIGGAGGFFGGGLGGLFLGMIAGAIVAALVSFAALAFLVCSRGPIALFLKALVMDNHEDSQIAQVIEHTQTWGDAFCMSCTHLLSAPGLT